MIEALLARHEELNAHAQEHGCLLTTEAIEWKGIKQILGDYGFTYIACS